MRSFQGYEDSTFMLLNRQYIRCTFSWLVFSSWTWQNMPKGKQNMLSSVKEDELISLMSHWEWGDQVSAAWRRLRHDNLILKSKFIRQPLSALPICCLCTWRDSSQNGLSTIFEIFKVRAPSCNYNIMPFEWYLAHFIYRYIFEVMIRSIMNFLIILFIFQQRQSHISQIDQNGYNPFCDATLHISSGVAVVLIPPMTEPHGSILEWNTSSLRSYKFFWVTVKAFCRSMKGVQFFFPVKRLHFVKYTSLKYQSNS